MAMRTIKVDDEVFAALEREAKAFVETTPNDVLRRVLLSKEPGSAPEKAGDLMPLIKAGHVRAGDKLVHHQPRKRRTFTAVVTAGGYIELDDGRPFAEPSPALRECVGHQINGWTNWRLQRTGQVLDDLRNL